MAPLVSVIMPTNRPERHAMAYRWFARSRYPNRELLVFDDSPQPSEFFRGLNDRRVSYLHAPGKWSIGAKRNHLITQSRGQVIAHQDDDDSYHPTYLGAMVQRLSDADLVKLSVFNVYDERDGSKWRWDTRSSGGAQKLLGAKFSLAVPSFGLASTEKTRWGYGFCYVYRRALYEHGVRFPDIDRGEDYEFVRAARAAGARLKQVDDCADLVWHVVHDLSTSACAPQARIDGGPQPTPLGGYVALALCGTAVGALVGGPVGAVVGGGLAKAAIAREVIKNRRQR
jgi:hypothetical protein